MNVDELKARFPDEHACRQFLESVIWRNGRACPHCSFRKSYPIRGKRSRPGLYECGRCKHQFTVTTRTPLHSTKLTLWKWIQAMYYIVNSSKGVSSVFLAKWIGISQKSAWKMGHAIRQMMAPDDESQPALNGIVELDEKYIGGKPRYEKGVQHKRGKGTAKQCVFVAVQRNGPVRTSLVNSNRVCELAPLVEGFVHQDSYLMTDENHAYISIGTQYAAHFSVNHGEKEYARGNVHNNTAESFSSILERAKFGVFHYMSKKHLARYLNEIGFRWDHRIPERKKTKKGKWKTIMKPMPVLMTFSSLLGRALGCQLRRSPNGGILCNMHSSPIT